MTEDSRLIPTPEQAVFLLTTPPKSLFHDSHKCVQIQRIVHKSETTSDLRIKPIFNLEYHKLFATRIIELEDNDTKIAEFHPSKSHREQAEPQHVDGRTRRKRTWSIDHSGGEFGGKINSNSRSHGLCDMTVVGSEPNGVFLFQSADGQALHWQRIRDASGARWVLVQAGQSQTAVKPEGRQSTDARHPLPRTSYEFGKAPRASLESSLPQPPVIGIARTETSSTLASQYTTHFNNESQLSGLTNTPQVDERDIPLAKSTGQNGSSHDRETGDEHHYATLMSSPVPNLKIMLRDAHQPRHSMHNITRTNNAIYRILLCALWITWSSSDIFGEAEPSNKHLQLDVNEGTGRASGLPMADRHSKIGQSRSSERSASKLHTRSLRADSDADERHKSPKLKQNQAAQQQQVTSKADRRGGFLGTIARICGS